MRWLDDIADVLGPEGFGVLLVIYTAGAVIFLATCGC